MDKRKWEESEQNFMRNLDDAQNMINNLQQSLAESQDSQSRSMDNYKEDSEKTMKDMSEKVRVLEQGLKQKDEMVIFFFGERINDDSIKLRKDLLKKRKL